MIIIIGAGIAGLTCAKYLKEKGANILVLEAADAVGGRVRTDLIENFKLDRGFQVFLTSYPEAQKILDYDALQLQKLPSGARVRSGADFFVMPNPLKNILTAPQALFSPVGGLFDKVRVLKLNAETRTAPEPDENSKLPEATLTFLKDYGYSDTMIKRFFRPFFRGVFLERELKTDSSFFKFLYKHFADGDVTVPAAGMQAIPEQLAAHLAPEELRLNTAVEKIEGKTVFLANGETLEAEKIVVATDAKTAAKLLGEDLKIEFNSTACLYFESDAPLKFEDAPYLIINSNSDELIDHLLIASAVAPSYAPEGKTLISVNIVGRDEFSETDLQAKVQAELAKWFGEKIAWRHLKTYRIPEALPQYFDHSPYEHNLKISESVYRCGDYAAYPSLNAAMKTGREVSEMIVV